jgi:hypothetical protein
MSFGSILLIMHLIMSLVSNYAMVLRGQDGATRFVLIPHSHHLSLRLGRLSSSVGGSFPCACLAQPERLLVLEIKFSA